MRISDHSCGTNRIVDEKIIVSVQKGVDFIERFYFPERFEKVVTYSWASGPIDLHDKDLEVYPHEYKIEGTRTTKAGKTINVVLPKNVSSLEYKRI